MCMLGAKVNSKIIIIIKSNEEEEKEFWMRRYKENKKETRKAIDFTLNTMIILRATERKRNRMKNFEQNKG